VLLLAFGLGARSLDRDAIWLDEYFSIYDSGAGPYGPLTPADIWNRVAERNPWHSPGFFILLNGWGRLVGFEPAALRAFSLLFGVLAVAMTYPLGRVLASRRVGLYAAVVLATSAFFIYYTHEIRMYTLIAFLSATTLLVYHRLMRAGQTVPVGLLVAWFGCCVATVYTHYLAAVPLGVLGVYHLLFMPKNRRWWQVSGVAVLAALAFLPWFSNLLSGLELAADAETLHARALSSRRLLELVARLFGNGSLLLVGLTGVLVLLKPNRQTGRLLFLAFGPLALFLILNRLFQIIPDTRIRYLLSLWPVLAVVVAVGLTRLQRWPALPLVGLAVWAASGIVILDNSDYLSTVGGVGYVFPLHQVDDVMREQSQPGDAVVYYLSDDMARITYERQADYYAGWRGLVSLFIEPRADDRARDVVREAVLAQLEGRTRVWLVHIPGDPVTGWDVFTSALAARYRLCGPVLQSATLQVDLYAVSADQCARQALAQ